MSEVLELGSSVTVKEKHRKKDWVSSYSERKRHFFFLLKMLSQYTIVISIFYSVQFSHSVVSDSLRPHGLQHARLPCPSPTPRTYSNSCLLSQWCHPTISSCLPLLLLPSIFPNIRVFSNESVLHIRWLKYWSFSFSISPSNEYSGLISFRIDWLYLLGSPRDSQESFPTSQFKSINSQALSCLYSPTLTSIDYWKNHSFD